MKITRDWLNDYLDHPATTDDIVETLDRLGFPVEDVEPLPSGDERLDVEVTSNRGDCIGVLGLAREFVAGHRDFHLRSPALQTAGLAVGQVAGEANDINLVEAIHGSLADQTATVENREHGLCPYYSARIIRGVKVGPSPDWLRERIEGVGLRSVNNIVDVTNFVLFELGQPLHAFDLAHVRGPKIIVRRAEQGETMTAIDGSKLTLESKDLVIADAERPVAVAGVMGGLDSEVGEQTVDVLLEAAVFAPLNVRTTARRLKLMTDSSHRFERGIHPASVPFAAERAVDLILKVAGGTREPGVAEAGDLDRVKTPSRPVVELRAGRCRSLLGENIPVDDMIDSLKALGLAPQRNGVSANGSTGSPTISPDGAGVGQDRGSTSASESSSSSGSGSEGSTALISVPRGLAGSTTPDDDDAVINCVVPLHRLDLEREVDLIEEVARLHGLAHIPTRDKIDIEVAPLQIDVVNRRLIEDALTACGFFEVVTFSFISVADAKRFLPDGFSMLSVADERRKAEPVLRPSLLPSLLRCRKRNQDLGHKEARLFEHAVCYCLRGNEKVEQSNLGLVLDADDRQHGLRMLRTAIDRIVRNLRGGDAELVIRPVKIPWFADDASASVLYNDEVIGTMGLLAPAVQKDFDLQTPICAAELALGDLLYEPMPISQVQDVPTQPAIERDLSVVIDEPIAWSKILEVASQVEHPHLVSIDFVGVFRGKQIGAGRKSLTFRMMYRSPDRTLRHDEVTPHVDAVVERLVRETDATLRQ